MYSMSASSSSLTTSSLAAATAAVIIVAKIAKPHDETTFQKSSLEVNLNLVIALDASFINILQKITQTLLALCSCTSSKRLT